jgi:hypothetical protein
MKNIITCEELNSSIDLQFVATIRFFKASNSCTIYCGETRFERRIEFEFRKNEFNNWDELGYSFYEKILEQWKLGPEPEPKVKPKPKLDFNII